MNARGTTLIELVVVLAVLAVIAGVSGLVLSTLRSEDVPANSDIVVAAARREALNTRRPVTFRLDSAGTTLQGTALPDGRVIAEAMLGVDALSGRPADWEEGTHAR